MDWVCEEMEDDLMTTDNPYVKIDHIVRIIRSKLHEKESALAATAP
jgi:hypothetical protein